MDEVRWGPRKHFLLFKSRSADRPTETYGERQTNIYLERDIHRGTHTHTDIDTGRESKPEI